MSRSPLVHGLRVARALFTSQYALMLEYRAEIALWALSGVLPLIMLGVWSGSGAGADAGLSPLQLGRYFLAAFVVRQFTIVWVIQAFEEDNLQGRLSPYLLQPLPPLWRSGSEAASPCTKCPSRQAGHRTRDKLGFLGLRSLQQHRPSSRGTQ